MEGERRCDASRSREQVGGIGWWIRALTATAWSATPTRRQRRSSLGRVSTATSAIRSTSGAGSSTGRSGLPARACSTSGAVPVAISRRVREVEPSSGAVGMDLSAGMAAEAFSFAPTLVGDAQAIPFRADAFDIVLAAHMLYHVPDIDAALREIARVLRPDGTLLVVLNGRAHLPAMRTLVRQVLGDVVRESGERGACRSGARNAFRSRRPNRS